MILNILDLLILGKDRGALEVIFWVEDQVFRLRSKIVWLPFSTFKGGIFDNLRIDWSEKSHLLVDRGNIVMIIRLQVSKSTLMDCNLFRMMIDLMILTLTISRIGFVGWLINGQDSNFKVLSIHRVPFSQNQSQSQVPEGIAKPKPNSKSSSMSINCFLVILNNPLSKIFTTSSRLQFVVIQNHHSLWYLLICGHIKPPFSRIHHILPAFGLWSSKNQ